MLLPEFGVSVGFCFPATESQTQKSSDCVNENIEREVRTFGPFKDVSISVPFQRIGVTFASNGALCFSVGTPIGIPVGNLGREISVGSQPPLEEAFFAGG